jgi:iron(III) transport system permease protein
MSWAEDQLAGVAIPSRRAKKRIRLNVPFFAMTLVAGTAGFLVLYPLGMLLFGSFWTSRPGFPGAFTLQNYITAYTDIQTYWLFLNTALLIGAKTLIAATISVILAWIVTRTDTPYRGLLEILIIVPYFIPGILEAIGWIMLLSPRSGTINVLLVKLFGLSEPPFNIYSLGGMIWVMSIGSGSFMFLLIVSALRSMDASLEEAARTSGAGPIWTALTVTLPMIAPVILGASMLSFIRAMDSFEVPVLLGLPAKIFVFSNRIYAAVEYDYPVNYGLATSLGVSLIALTLGLILIQNKLLRGKEFFVITGKGYKPQVVRLGRFRYVTFAICITYFLISTVLPLSQIVIGSFVHVFGMVQIDNFTLDNYKQIVADPVLWRGLRNTIFVGGVAAIFTMLLCSIIAYITTRTHYVGRHVLDFIVWLPWTIPGIVAGLGILWAYIRFPIPLYGTMALLMIAFVTNGLPLGVRLMAGSLIQLGPELEECSRVLGANWIYTFRKVIMPLVRPAMAAVVLMLFVAFSRSVSSVILLAGHGTELLSVVLFKHTQAGEMETVAAASMVLLLISVAGLVLARRLGAFGVREIG